MLEFEKKNCFRKALKSDRGRKRITFDGGVRLLDIDDLGWSSWSDISQRCARLIDLILEVRHAGSSDVRCARTTTLRHSNENVNKLVHALYLFVFDIDIRQAFEWKQENLKRDATRQLPLILYILIKYDFISSKFVKSGNATYNLL